MATEAVLYIIPAVIMGIILGIVELIFVHQDESGMHWMAHGLHAIPVMFIFTFISMNVGWALGLIKVGSNMWIEVGVRVLVGIIAMVKIASAAAIAGRVGEKKFHVLIIGALVVVAPYLWIYAIGPLLNSIPALKFLNR